MGFLKRLKEVADEIVGPHDSTAKLAKWLSYAFFAGLFVSTVGHKYVLPQFKEPSNPSPTTLSQDAGVDCVDFKQLTSLQESYDAQLAPILARWIEITRETERTDLLPYERSIKLEIQSAIGSEMERIQARHQEIISEISNVCPSE